MADTRDPDQSKETAQSEVFMTPQEVEDRKKKDRHYDVVSDIKMGHAKVPTFLKFVYGLLAAWGLFYMLTAKPVNDRIEAAPITKPTAEAGAEVFSGSCAGCHNVTADRKVGPGLKGVTAKLGKEELVKVLLNGRPDKGMPAPPALGLNESQVESLRLYLETLK